MYKLYWRPGTASFAPEVLLEEMGATYEKVLIAEEQGSNAPASYRAVSPLGQVPALQLPDGTTMTESAAIMLYLADLQPELGLAPAATDPQRAVYLRWMIFLTAKLYQSYRHIYHADDYTDEDALIPSIRETALKSLEADWHIIDAALADGPYLLGETFSAADIYCAMFPDWNTDRDGVLERHPNIARLCESVLARPTVARVRPLYMT